MFKSKVLALVLALLPISNASANVIRCKLSYSPDTTVILDLSTRLMTVSNSRYIQDGFTTHLKYGNTHSYTLVLGGPAYATLHVGGTAARPLYAFYAVDGSDQTSSSPCR